MAKIQELENQSLWQRLNSFIIGPLYVRNEMLISDYFQEMLPSLRWKDDLQLFILISHQSFNSGFQPQISGIFLDIRYISRYQVDF